MKKVNRISRILLSSIALAFSVHAANYEVSTTADFKHKLSVAVAGDTIFVMPGTYMDPEPRNSSSVFNLANEGTQNAPIVIKSFELHKAVIQAVGNNAPALGIWLRDYVVVDGFRVEGAIGFREGANYGVLRNCDVSVGYIQGGDVSLHWGIYVQGSDFCLVENNYVHDMGPIGNQSHNGACFMLFGGGSDQTTGNIFQNNVGDGGDYMYGAFGQKGGNIIANTWRRNLGKNSKVGYLGMGSTDGTRYSNDNVYYENVSVDCGTFIEFDHNCQNWEVYNNTAIGASTFIYGGYKSEDKRNKDHQMWNNIGGDTRMYYQGISTPSPWTYLLTYSDYNLMTGKACAWHEGTKSYDLPAWKSNVGMDGNGLAGTPQYANSGNGDYRLASGSTGTHAGINRDSKTPGYDGQSPDMGAYPRHDNTLIGYNWSLAKIEDARPTTSGTALAIGLPARGLVASRNSSVRVGSYDILGRRLSRVPVSLSGNFSLSKELLQIR